MRILPILVAAGCCWAQTAQERLPKWLKLSGELRARAEGRTGYNFTPGDNDAYVLSRARFNVNLVPTDWIDVSFQGQDARVAGMDAGRPLGIFKNPADVRQAFVRLGKANGPARLTIGRQLLNYGGQRLLGPLDWTNNSRTWDAVKLELGTAKAKVDLFASSAVQSDPLRRLDQPRRGFNIHGAYGALNTLVPHSRLEPYLLWKTGNASIWNGGFRLVSLPGDTALRGWDYQVEVVRQWGTLASRTHAAGALSFTAGRTIGAQAWKPRVSGEYNYASGDRDPNDSTHRTFDHLLGTNHLYYGLVDAVGWQNMHNVRLGLDAKPRKAVQVNLDYHWLWLASAADALYDVAGRATVRPAAGNAARAIGTELDATVMWTLSRQWRLGGGLGHLFAGEFLKRNSRGSGQTFPYLFAQYSF